MYGKGSCSKYFNYFAPHFTNDWQTAYWIASDRKRFPIQIFSVQFKFVIIVTVTDQMSFRFFWQNRNNFTLFIFYLWRSASSAKWTMKVEALTFLTDIIQKNVIFMISKENYLGCSSLKQFWSHKLLFIFSLINQMRNCCECLRHEMIQIQIANINQSIRQPSNFHFSLEKKKYPDLLACAIHIFIVVRNFFFFVVKIYVLCLNG